MAQLMHDLIPLAVPVAHVDRVVAALHVFLEIFDPFVPSVYSIVGKGSWGDSVVYIVQRNEASFRI